MINLPIVTEWQITEWLRSAVISASYTHGLTYPTGGQLAPIDHDDRRLTLAMEAAIKTMHAMAQFMAQSVEQALVAQRLELKLESESMLETMPTEELERRCNAMMKLLAEREKADKAGR